MINLCKKIKFVISNNTKSYMKSNIIILLILPAILTLISSCGDDTTTNNPNSPAGTVLFSRDSISI